MTPSNPTKLGIAFAAGIVVALASAMVYVKTGGFHAPDADATSAVQQSGQPETLNAAKVEVPQARTARVARATTPADTPAPAAAPVSEIRNDPPQSAAIRPAVIRRTAPRPSAHTYYPRHSSGPDSQSTIRVEVSQMTPSVVPPATPAQVAAASAPLVRTVNEDQARMPPQPPSSGPRFNAPPPPVQPHTVTLQPGTSLIVRLGETISTEHNYSGDTFRATLDRPVVLDGFVIADKGSKVLGKVVGADKAGKFEGTANLQLTLTEINTTDGQRVRVETGFFSKKGPTNTRQEAEKIGGGAVLGAIIGAIAGGGKGAAIGAGAGGAAGTGAVLLGKGKPAVIPSETQLTFQLASPTTITERLN